MKTYDFRTTPYCIALALTNAKKVSFLKDFTFVGANAYKVDKIVSVKELLETLLAEYQDAVRKNEK